MAKKRQVTTSADGQNIVQVNVKMPKAKRAPVRKRLAPPRKKPSVSVKGTKIEKAVLENLIALQKIYTANAEKFDKLSGQLSNLLSLFEMAAKSFAEHPAIQSSEKDKEFLDKINKLMDQNKTIARGLSLMGEKVKERIYGQPEGETEGIISEVPHDIRESPPIPLAPPRQPPVQYPPFSQKIIEAGEEGFVPKASGKPLPKY